MNNTFTLDHEICWFHAYQPFANQTLQWLSSDTQELYEKNLKTRVEELNQFGWTDSGIEYQFNSQGFRCTEFDTDPGVMFLGCSHTMGIGMPESETWTSLVANELKLRCWNLGLGGTSNDVAFRMAYHWIPILNTKLCVLMCPDKSRLEIIQHNDSSLQINLGDSNPPIECRAWYHSDHNAQINWIKNTMAIAEICRQHHVKFVYATVEKDFVKIDYARDLCHWGRKSHVMTAEKVLDCIAGDHE
jgi:hypothetical protein